jgi:methylated-DNA-protein-cysteine methyltransferase-like protein
MNFRMTKNKDFFQAVYDIVRLIPEGKVTTYGAIAEAIGTKGSARMVGWAMNASHSLTDIPAHRVVNRKGLLTGKMHFADPSEMQRKLKAEGIPVVDDQIQGFDSFFWDPKELG